MAFWCELGAGIGGKGKGREGEEKREGGKKGEKKEIFRKNRLF